MSQADPSPSKVYNWSKLDEYASYLHEQDCIRQQLGAKALQRKFKMDLDAQVTQKQHRKLAETDEERVYHENQMTELERWKEMEREREEEKQNKIMREKADRDLQLEYERKLKNEEMERKKNEEAQLVSKIVDEMETEQKKFERKKAQQRKSMRKVFEENALDQQKRKQEKQEQMAKEAQAMKDYARAMEEQEEKRQQEMNARIERRSCDIGGPPGEADDGIGFKLTRSCPKAAFLRFLQVTSGGEIRENPTMRVKWNVWIMRRRMPRIPS